MLKLGKNLREKRTNFIKFKIVKYSYSLAWRTKLIITPPKTENDLKQKILSHIIYPHKLQHSNGKKNLQESQPKKVENLYALCHCFTLIFAYIYITHELRKKATPKFRTSRISLTSHSSKNLCTKNEEAILTRIHQFPGKTIPICG